MVGVNSAVDVEAVAVEMVETVTAVVTALVLVLVTAVGVVAAVVSGEVSSCAEPHRLCT